MGFFKEIRSVLRKDDHTVQVTKGTPLSETPFSSTDSLGGKLQVQVKTRKSTHNFFKRGGRAIGRRIRVKLNLIDTTDNGGEALSLIPPSPPSKDTAQDKRIPNQEAFDIRYKELDKLAEGGNGIVHLCKDLRIGTLVAVKTIPRSTRSSGEPSEVRILRKLGEHANIVRYHACLDSPANRHEQKIVFEYCSMGDLTDYCGTLEDGIPECFIWSVFKQVGDALLVMHKQGIVHGDLKMSNVLVTPPIPGSPSPYPVLKVADFGASRIRPQRWVPRAHMGTWDYMPPEATELFGPETDMWCLGVILHALALGVEPIKEVVVEETDVDFWFNRRWSFVPKGTPHQQDFKYFAYWQAGHPSNPLRIDRGRVHACYKTKTQYSKASNWFMMRCLDLDWKTRISSFEVQRFVGTIEGFARRAFMKGHEDLLEKFEDGRNDEWGVVTSVKDSEVVLQLYVAVCDRAVEWRDECLLKMVEGLPEIMDAQEYAVACLYTGGLVGN